MKKEMIVQRLIEDGHITSEEAVILLKEFKEIVTVPYQIEDRNDLVWISTVS